MPVFGTKQKSEFGSLDYYRNLAAQHGVEVEEPKKRESLFQKTIDILQRPNYAVAGLVGAFTERGRAAGENPLQEALDGLTGREKETFSDVLKDVGVENKWARGIAGFALDIALDPTTYFGGALVKGALKGAKLATKGAAATGKAVGLGRQIRALETTAETVGEALKKSFQYGYGTASKVTGLTGYADDALDGLKIVGDEVFEKTIDDVGTEILGKRVGVIENGVIKNRAGGEQIGSVQSIIGKTQAFFSKALQRTDDYDELLANNQKLFSEFDNKTLEKAADILIHNRQVAKGLKKGEILLGEGDVARAVKMLKGKGQSLGEGLESVTGIKGEDWYFPFLKKDSLLKPKMYKDLLEKTDQDFAKKWKNIIPEKDLLKDPIEAFSRREYELGHDLIRQESLDQMIKAFGKGADAFKSTDEAIAAGFRPIYRDGSQELIGFGSTKKAAKKLGYLQADDARFVDNALFPEFKTIDMLAKASGYDKFTSAFKQLVTAWFPAFHIRNMFSGYVQNYSVLGARALDPTNIPQGIKVMSEKLAKKAGVENIAGHTIQDIRDALIEKFGYSSQYVSDVNNVANALEAGQKFSKVKKLNPRRVGNWIEMNQKANATIGALKQGKSLDEALNLAEKAGFDYSKITQFESKVMKRAIPFYTFARKNAALQLSTLKKNPERILNQVKFTNALSNVFAGGKPTEAELDGLPPWALNAMGFKLQNGKYVSKFGLPVEEFIERVADPFKTTMSSLNPLVKYPIEAKTGYDFFREGQIKDITSVKEPTAKILTHEKTPQWIKDAFHVTSYEGKDGKRYYNADAENLHKLRNIPLSRFQNTADKLFTDGVTNLTPQKIASFLIGAQLYDIDTELQSHFTEKDLKKAYQEELESRGIIYDPGMFFESKTTEFDFKK